MKPSEALDAHRAELRALVARYGFLGARVFGSVATRTDGADSDLDIVVEPVRGSTTLLTLGGFQAQAEELLGVPVDVLTPEALPKKYRDTVLAQAERL
jgi:predicted nucleotidyltransferase